MFHCYLCDFVIRSEVRDRDVPTRGREGVTLPIFSNLRESWSKGSHAARELATVFSVTSFFLSNNSWSIGQSAPPQKMVSRHIPGCGISKMRKKLLSTTNNRRRVWNMFKNHVWNERNQAQISKP